MWQIAILVSGLLTGIGQFLGKRQVKYMSAMQSVMITNVAAMGVLTLALVISRQYSLWQPGLLILLALGVVESLAIAAYYAAVRESLSGATVFGYLLSQVVIVLVSFGLFGEWVYFDPQTARGWGNIFALALTMVALYFYSGSLKIGRRWAGLIVVSALINAVANIGAKYGLGIGVPPILYLFVEQVGLLLGSWIYVVGKSQKMTLTPRSWGIGTLQGIFAVAGPMIYIYVLLTEPLSLASVVRRLAALLVTVGMGLLFYRERENLGRRGWGALILGLAAFGLVLWVNR